MKEYFESMELLEKAIHLYNRIENKKRDFGLGYEMSMKEIHTIQYIGDYPGINLKTLATNQGVTKGAASQMITRLIKKNLVTKERGTNSEAEIVLTLTKEGQRAYKGHEEYHKKGKHYMQDLAEKYTEKDWQIFRSILLDLEACLLDVSCDILEDTTHE